MRLFVDAQVVYKPCRGRVVQVRESSKFLEVNTLVEIRSSACRTKNIIFYAHTQQSLTAFT